MTATTQDLEAARLLLSRLGVEPADLIGDAPAGSTDDERPPTPTLGEWIPVVAGLVSPSTASSYGSYWKKAEARWGERPMDTITAGRSRMIARCAPSHDEQGREHYEFVRGARA